MAGAGGVLAVGSAGRLSIGCLVQRPEARGLIQVISPDFQLIFRGSVSLVGIVIESAEDRAHCRQAQRVDGTGLGLGLAGVEAGRGGGDIVGSKLRDLTPGAGPVPIGRVDLPVVGHAAGQAGPGM